MRVHLSSLLLMTACQGDGPDASLDTSRYFRQDTAEDTAAVLENPMRDCLDSIHNLSDTAGVLLYSPESVDGTGGLFESQTGPEDVHADLQLIVVPDKGPDAARSVPFEWVQADRRNLLVVRDWNFASGEEVGQVYGVFNDCQNAAAWGQCPEIPTPNGSLTGCELVDGLWVMNPE